MIAPMRIRRSSAVVVFLLTFAGCQLASRAAADGDVSAGGVAAVSVEELVVKVLAVYPHDPRAFSQGLIWHDGALLESTGQYSRSTLRRVDPVSGTVLARRDLDPGLFGEGLALAGGRLVQLTWYAGLAMVYDLASLEPVGQLDYHGEGWGLAWDGERFVMSNGSSLLAFRDATTFEVLGEVEVTQEGQAVGNLNELEVAEGAIYANIWYQDWIAKIDPQTGQVTARIDASKLLTRDERRRLGNAGVLNGIAYDPASRTFWLTGKYWPKMFQVTFVPRS
jgi:glutamine cyclotransferase